MALADQGSLSPRGLEGECPQEERSASITKQLVFHYPFCRKTRCNRVLERFLLVEGIPGRPKRALFSVS